MIADLVSVACWFLRPVPKKHPASNLGCEGAPKTYTWETFELHRPGVDEAIRRWDKAYDVWTGRAHEKFYDDMYERIDRIKR